MRANLIFFFELTKQKAFFLAETGIKRCNFRRFAPQTYKKRLIILQQWWWVLPFLNLPLYLNLYLIHQQRYRRIYGWLRGWLRGRLRGRLRPWLRARPCVSDRNFHDLPWQNDPQKLREHQCIRDKKTHSCNSWLNK